MTRWLLLCAAALSGCSLFGETTSIDAQPDASIAAPDSGETTVTDDAGRIDAQIDAAVERFCGDGNRDDGESCDDGNRRSHDGCSSVCELETFEWTQHQPTYHRSRADSGMAALPGTNELIIYGGEAAPGEFRTDTISYSLTSGTWRTIETSNVPTAVTHMSMARLNGTDTVILFGGRNAAGNRLNETWAFDGSEWTELSPATSPSARSDFDMIEFGSFGIVLFGGQGNSGPLNDTWLFDGTTWSLIDVGQTAPPPRNDHYLASGPVGSRIYLHGGDVGGQTMSDIWFFNGTSWTEAVTTNTPDDASVSEHVIFSTEDGLHILHGKDTSGEIRSGQWRVAANGTWSEVVLPVMPPLREEAELVALGDDVYLFGGRLGAVPRGDLWRFRDGQWTSLTPNEWPPARDDNGIVSDPATGHVYMFGGSNDDAADDLADTWSWHAREGWVEHPNAGLPGISDFSAGRHSDGTIWLVGGNEGENNPVRATILGFADGSWQELATGSITIEDSSMAWSPLMETFLLFGGSIDDRFSDELYAWRETDWQAVDPGPIKPRSRVEAAAVWDDDRGRLVSFGGRSSQYEALSDHLEYDGSVWQGRSFDTQPSARYDHAMGRHELTGEILLHGGKAASRGEREDLWLFDGEEWELVAVATRPARRGDHAMAFSTSGAGFILFGGNSDLGTTADSWLLRYNSDWPAQICDGTDSDDDMDGLAGCDDPDCEVYCR